MNPTTKLQTANQKLRFHTVSLRSLNIFSIKTPARLEDVEEINTDLIVEEQLPEEEVKTESPKKKSVKTKTGKDLSEMLNNIQEKLDKSSEEDAEVENAEATPNKKEKSSK